MHSTGLQGEQALDVGQRDRGGGGCVNIDVLDHQARQVRDTVHMWKTVRRGLLDQTKVGVVCDTVAGHIPQMG